MLVTDLGIVTLVKLLQYPKAPSPMLVIPSSITALLKLYFRHGGEVYSYDGITPVPLIVRTSPLMLQVIVSVRLPPAVEGGSSAKAVRHPETEITRVSKTVAMTLHFLLFMTTSLIVL